MPGKTRRAKEKEAKLAQLAAKCPRIEALFGTKEKQPPPPEPASNTSEEEKASVVLPPHYTPISDDSGDEHSDPDTEPAAADLEATPGPSQEKACNAKHSEGFNMKWFNIHPSLRNWLIHQHGDEDGSHFFCKVCKKHKVKALNGSVVWTEKPFRTARLDAVRAHETSRQHTEALKKEADASTGTALQTLTVNDRPIVNDLFRILKYICFNDMPLSKFGSMVELSISVGAPRIPLLQKGKNATYTSESTMIELLEILASEVEESLLEDIQKSPFFSLMMDETCDVAVKKNLALACRYFDTEEGIVQNAFVQDMFVPDGSADTIYEAVVKTVNEKELDCNKLGGVGTDGASVMTGRVNGVVTKMKALEPNIIAVHCVNHRLALASKDSFGQMPVLVNLEETLEALFKYYNYSSKKKGSLEQLQTLLTSEERGRAVTIKHAAHTRWLSHDAAVDSVRKAYDAILVDLESEVVKPTTGEAGAKASGLKKRMMQYNTLACILLLADVLPRLAQLSLHFQKEKVDLTMIDSMLSSTLKSIGDMKETPGRHLAKLETLAEKYKITKSHNQNFELTKCRYIDATIASINKRLENSSVVRAMGVLDFSNVSGQRVLLPSLYGNEEIETLAEYFGLESDEVLSQWDRFKDIYWPMDSTLSTDVTLQGLCAGACKQPLVQSACPAICKFLAVAATLPMSTATLERIFSHLKLIKTAQRNRLGEDHLNKILMIKLNGRYVSEGLLQKCTNAYLSKKDRRLSLNAWKAAASSKNAE
ncbi:zinc finger protein 862-like [Lineus longissimus]|uniref:zinc finger protein 862-like n=1 Tax=Lineus longissimus TaxID=88925 RepID=UPI00315DABEE